ncbi:SusC/RagA family TonB-linked outer membrane protein [Zobellia sp. OII3]|uniref:SusC/RagA family TonB-linked outer membrane protein n=1 Tax=Zobellia sp. OII3 TaxID=2034520 RepID=UPI001374793A|nr:SusC/RagA family TonB-linked outer membrane protein [Zobellia sp. OII3]
MKKLRPIYLVITALLWLSTHKGMAQDTSELFEVSATLLNEAGEVCDKATIVASNSKNRTFTDLNGVFSIRANKEDVLVISALGYERTTVNVTNGELESTSIILKEWGTIDADRKISVAYGDLPFERITGSVERITGDELSDYPTTFVQEALAGRLSGLTSNYGSASPEIENFSNSVRGAGVGEMYLDGIPSNLVLTPGEVDNIVLAKDYGSSFLYGITAAPGAMIVKTKKGLKGDRSIKFKVRRGVRTPTFLPEMMNSQDYTKNYNQALANDGISPIYDQNTIDAYTNKRDTVRNPNQDYHKKFVSDLASYRHITGEFSGGNEITQYFSHLGYYTTDGIESEGDGRKLSRLRLNNNLQIKVSDFVSVDLGIGGSFNKRKAPLMSGDDAFNTMYQYPANALPFKINDSIYARNPEYGTNLLVNLAHGSIIEDTRRDANARLGLNFDLSTVAKGLNFSSLVGLYSYNNLSKRLDPTVDMAEPFFTKTLTGQDTLVLRNYTKGATDTGWAKLGDRVDRNQFIKASFNYDRSFGDHHDLTADLIYTKESKSGSQLGQEEHYRNIGFRANYLMAKKYVFEGNWMNSAVRQLQKKQRRTITYATGVAWLAHKENFLKSSQWLDFLKLRANYGMQGRPVGQFFLEDNQYSGSGAGTFGIVGATSSSGGYRRVFTGADDIVMPKQEYLNVGFDFQMFKHKLNGQINYYNIRNYDELVVPNNLYALLAANDDYLPYINFSDNERKGFDGSISYRKKLGDFRFSIGANAMYNTTYVTKSNSINYPEEARNQMGNQGGRIIGLEADGIFQNQAEIDAAIPSKFGEVKPGDIRYKDYNGDGTIDEKDYHEIGHSPRLSYGLNYGMKYRNWAFSLHGDGVAGGSFNDGLYWSRGTDAYTQELSKSWPATNDLPRLTTLSNSNNYRNSSFWLKDASYFNVRSITLEYTIPQNIIQKSFIKEITFFTSGKNLFVLSSVKDRYMPSPNKGYSQYPVLKSYEVGLEVSF